MPDFEMDSDARIRSLLAGYVDMRGACAFTNLSRRSLDYAKARGDLGYVRKGRKILFALADLTAYMERDRVDVSEDIARIEAATAPKTDAVSSLLRRHPRRPSASTEHKEEN